MTNSSRDWCSLQKWAQPRKESLRSRAAANSPKPKLTVGVWSLDSLFPTFCSPVRPRCYFPTWCEGFACDVFSSLCPDVWNGCMVSAILRFWTQVSLRLASCTAIERELRRECLKLARKHLTRPSQTAAPRLAAKESHSTYTL